MAVSPGDVRDVGQWLALRLDEVARWREKKAVDFPDDVRNVRSGKALHEAAQYVRVTGDRSHGLKRISRIVSAARQSSIELLAPTFGSAPLPGIESQRVASRYFFDNLSSSTDEMTHEELLDELATSSLRDLQEHLFEVPSESPIAKLLREESPTSTDPMLAALIEIRDRLADSAGDVAAQKRSRRLDRLSGVSDLVARVRDVAISEEAAGKRIGGLDVGTPPILPQTRMQLDLAVKSYEAETGRTVPECENLATGSTMTSAMAIVSAATSAYMELQREFEDMAG